MHFDKTQEQKYTDNEKTHGPEDISLASNAQYNLLDNGALNGLRGFFAFYIMVHHAWTTNPQIASSNSTIHLYGDVLMPLYLMLSGFSVSLAYGKIRWSTSAMNRLGYQASSSNAAESLPFPRRERRIFPIWSFYRKRFIKTLPVHVLGIAFSLILWNFRYPS